MTAAAAVFIASNKRDAVTALASMAAPLLVLLMLIELFRKPGRMMLALWLLLALGTAAAYQCYEQAGTDNASALKDYEANPQKVLSQLNIEPGTLKQWQFEHRLHSQDVRGFLTTSNSTGSFLLLCLFACLGLMTNTLRQDKSAGGTARTLLYIMAALYALIALALLGGLCLSKSRGAVTAGGLCLVGWLVCLIWGKRLWPYRKILFLLALILTVIILAAAVHYGNEHGRLPGPNALLVRWQYWVSTVDMIRDHPFLGVGGGNFAVWYPFYKIPAAPETIRDPHNFILSAASQYGLLGAAALLMIVLAPVLRLPLIRRPGETDTRWNWARAPLSPGFFLLVAVAIALLAFRPLVSEGTIAESNPGIRMAYYLVYYLVPAAIVILVAGLFLLILMTGYGILAPMRTDRSLLTAIGWGIGAVLIHNLIDFAFFETAVLMALVICLAALLAMHCPARPSPTHRRFSRYTAAAFLVAGFVAYFIIAVIPSVRAGAAIQQAVRDPQQAAALFAHAQQMDPLSPQAAWYSGQFDLQRFQQKILKNTDLLEQAADQFRQAARRNPAEYKMQEALGDTYLIMADNTAAEEQKTKALEKAYDYSLQAHQRYPGSDRIAFKLGTIAELLGRDRDAVGWYCLAVDIEDVYRKQFQEMYPEYDLFSRLGDQRYDYAKSFIQSRTQSSPENKSEDQ